ncbi:hypothetical protein BLOT_006310 [Blomia tropicalis]|nr:hypothetical protein BLOT_006310 [Blomia tropicalis]
MSQDFPKMTPTTLNVIQMTTFVCQETTSFPEKLFLDYKNIPIICGILFFRYSIKLVNEKNDFFELCVLNH